MTRNCHVRFGERGRETRLSQGKKVRSAPTLFSPLLANIALHGMEEALGVRYDKRGQIVSKRAVVRYADDFVVFCETQEEAELAKQTLSTWLETRGLTLSPEKTRVVHLSEGFDFLGFTIRHYKSTLTKSRWKLLITPSKKSVQKLRGKLREEWRTLQGSTNVQGILKRLNPIIRGWANYFRPSSNGLTRSYEDGRTTSAQQ